MAEQLSAEEIKIIAQHWSESSIEIVVGDAVTGILDADEAREVIIWQAERIAELEKENGTLREATRRALAHAGYGGWMGTHLADMNDAELQMALWDLADSHKATYDWAEEVERIVQSRLSMERTSPKPAQENSDDR